MTVSLPARSLTLDRSTASELRAELTGALAERRTFLRTAGVHRPDGSYVVERRGADSGGHRKVFDGLDALRELFDRLPGAFEAADLERPGLTGSRRHLVLRHLVEHPAFDCELASRQPLRVRKCDETENRGRSTAGEGGSRSDEPPEDS